MHFQSFNDISTITIFFSETDSVFVMLLTRYGVQKINRSPVI
jgi:hypothetical protein